MLLWHVCVCVRLREKGGWKIESALPIATTWGQQIEEHSCCLAEPALRSWDERQSSNTDAFCPCLKKIEEPSHIRGREF